MMMELPQRHRMRSQSTVSLRALYVVAAVAPIFACEPNGPSRLTAPLVASRSAATEELASPGWQAIEANLVAQANLAAVVSTRAYSLLGVAQYLAVQRAEGSRRDGRSSGDGSDAGAVAGASATVLSYLFPAHAQALEDTVKAQRSTGPGFARGEVIGRAVGAEIVARAAADGFATPFSGTIPVGPGLWISNTTPATSNRRSRGSRLVNTWYAMIPNVRAKPRKWIQRASAWSRNPRGVAVPISPPETAAR